MSSYEQRRAQMFPALNSAQLARITAHGQRQQRKRGDVLFEQGEQHTRFYVVLTGKIEIMRPTSEAETESVLTVHGPGEFTGEMNMLSARRSLVTARMAEDGELVMLERDDLRRLVQTDSELSELFMRAFILRRMGLIEDQQGDLVLVGSNHSAATLRIKEFLFRNNHPYSYMDVDRDPGIQELLDRFHIAVEDVPVVICRGGRLLRSPSNEQLAECLGFSDALDEQTVRDVIIVGAGPAGLAAAVYAASEGLDVLVLETRAPGGQAGSSSKIENYLGFPTGISGQALAGRAYSQAQKFGADVEVARSAAKLSGPQRPYRIELAGGGVVRGRAVVIASGAEYRKLPLPNLSLYEGAGVYYSATYMEGQLCGGEEVIVVGGGNSAGQAAVYLSGAARHVHVFVRGSGLSDTMSRYLIQRIEETPNISLHPRTEIEALEGDGRLERVRWRETVSGQQTERPIGRLFLMTGASPNTHWLKGCIELDDKGFVRTGSDLGREALARARWPLARPPHLLETSLPAVFAVGDVRSGSTKRVAAAVGEGSICISLVHSVLQE